jgi:DNA polymerase-3 subunit alpha
MELIEEWIGYMIYGNEEKGIEGALKRGFCEKKMMTLKEQWIKFGNYCFNRAHSAAYALLSVQTAWLKAHYPVEFMAALLTISEDKKKDDVSKSAIYIKEAEEMGIRVLPPDINLSIDSWSPETGEEGTKGIRFGLGGIANISGETMLEIMNNRPYASVEDLQRKTMKQKVNKTKIIALIKSGCFDEIDKNRNALLKEYIISRKENAEEIPEETTKRHIIEYEKEMLGVVISEKERWEQYEEGKKGIQYTGIIKDVTWLQSKKGNRYMSMLLQTPDEERPVIAFESVIKRCEGEPKQGMKVMIKGTKSDSKLLAEKIECKESGESEDEEV